MAQYIMLQHLSVQANFIVQTSFSKMSFDITFVGPNTRALPRSKRITEQTWERHREDIIREYRLGRGRGAMRAREWIKSQNIPDFDPK